MNFLKIIGLSFLFTTVIISCQNGNNKGEEVNDTTVAAVEDVNAKVIKDEFSDVSFQSVDSSVVKLSDLKGKVVFINFWATWCPPCIEEMPSIEVLYNKFRNNNDIVFLMVDVDGDIDNANSFMLKHNLKLPLYVMNSDIPRSFVQNAIPTTVILNKNGQIESRLEGSYDFGSSEMFENINQILQK